MFQSVTTTPQSELTGQPLSAAVLRRENRCFKGTGGISQENRSSGFAPAFLDVASGKAYRSCFSNGCPAPVHLLDGLPAHLLVRSAGTVRASDGLVSGFLRSGIFYTRKQAAEAVTQASLT